MGSVIWIWASNSVFLISRDLGVELGLLDLEGAGEQGDLSLLDVGGHPAVDLLLVDDDSLNEVGVSDDSSDLLLDADVLGVDDTVLLDGLACLDDDVGQSLLLLSDGFAGEGGGGDLLQDLVGLDVDGDVVEDLDGFGGCHLVSVGDDGGVDVGVDELLGLFEKLSGEDDAGGCSVSALGVLGLGDLNDHLGGGVLDIDLLQDGDTVVGDDDISDGVHEHLVHSLGSEGGPDGIGDRLGGCDVVELCLFVFAPLGALFEHDDGLVSASVHKDNLLITMFG